MEQPINLGNFDNDNLRTTISQIRYYSSDTNNPTLWDIDTGVVNQHQSILHRLTGVQMEKMVNV